MAALSSSAEPSSRDAPTVSTSFGMVRGVPAPADVAAFLGLPYAAAPLGPLRFAPPQSPPRWEGVRPALDHGFAPIQGAPSPGRFLADLSSPYQSEDCLTLSIWSPEADRAAKLPVLVWFYGGAFVAGSTSVPAYDGARLAARGAVVVAVNYRLGLFGWLRCPAIGADGNQGLHDQAAALRWVAANIEGFGGDPDNITVFGESAGAASIAAHLAGPDAPIFRRAILQSGSFNLVNSVAQAEDSAARILTHLGVEPAALRGLPTEVLRRAQDAATPRAGGVFYRPVADGQMVPLDPAAALADGTAGGARVPLLCGTNRDEMGFFWGRDPSFDHVTDDTLATLAARWHPHGEAALAVYRLARTERGEAVDNRALAMAMGGDWSFRVASMGLAGWQSARADTFAYRMDLASPLHDGLVGAAHVLDVALVMGTYDHPTVAAFAGYDVDPEPVAQVSEAMGSAWVSFATTGNPGWARYELTERQTRIFGGGTGPGSGGLTDTVIRHPQGEELRQWDPRGQRR